MGSTFLTPYHPISTMLLVEINAFIFIAVFVIAKFSSLFQALLKLSTESGGNILFSFQIF